MTATEKRRRFERWGAKNIARVEHPEYGLLIVPCENNYAARMCAAEVLNSGLMTESSAASGSMERISFHADLPRSSR